jgi:hypothetical protein
VPRDGKKSGSGINIPDHISESLVTTFLVKIPKLFVPDQGFSAFLTQDPGGINIPAPQQWHQIYLQERDIWIG